MSYTLSIQVDAQEDLREAWAYYESQQTGLGQQFMSAFLECALQIEGNPFLFQKVYKQKRRAVVRPFGYNVFYEVEGDSVRVSAIMHGSRDSQRWQKRK
jgi:plasmid stabilization system protein ParE